MRLCRLFILGAAFSFASPTLGLALEDDPAPAETGETEQRLSAAATDTRAALAAPALRTGQAGMGALAGFSIARVTAFGDSYTRLQRTVPHPVSGAAVRVRNWVEQANLDGFSGATAGYAVSGASAANIAVYPGKPVNSFAQQVQRWVGAGARLGAGEATAVFFGANDINAIQKLPSLASLQRSKNDYATSVTRLINLGATSGDRRLFLFTVHDWGRNPEKNGDPGLVYRSRVQSWNSFVTGFASGRRNVVTVDLFTTFNKVFANPASYGLTNVRTADLDRSRTTALYADVNHFGEKGHDIIEQTFLHYASRSWGFRAAAGAGAKASAKIAGETDQAIGLGVAQARAAALAQTGAGTGTDQGTVPPVTAFAVGAAALAPAGGSQDAAPAAVDADPTRLGFAQAYGGSQRPQGGFGVNYALSPERSVGVVIGHYDDRVTTELDQDQGSALVRSDAVSVYLDQKVRGFDLRSRVSVAEHDNELAEGDALTGSTSQASFKSRTVELSQRAGYPVAVAGAVLTPWLELTHRRDDAEPFTASNPYTADETYSASGASETLAGIGLDLGAAPILLGEHATLRLFGGLSYAQSLQRESFELKIEEAGGYGATQTETVERERVRQLSLNLGGELALDANLALGATLAVSRDPTFGTAQQMALRLNYRF